MSLNISLKCVKGNISNHHLLQMDTTQDTTEIRQSWLDERKEIRSVTWISSSTITVKACWPLVHFYLQPMGQWELERERGWAVRIKNKNLFAENGSRYLRNFVKKQPILKKFQVYLFHNAFRSEKGTIGDRYEMLWAVQIINKKVFNWNAYK